MDTLPVTLIVKAPNHAYQDHTVKCELSWTIKRLKGHLSEVYPCKPEEQKLIYSGQLLQDAVVLKDVLRQYDGQETETHTVHLVYTPKQMRMDSNTTNKESSAAGSSSSSTPSNDMSSGDSTGAGDVHANREGLRRRNVGTAVPSPTTITPQAQLPPMNLQALYSQPFATTTAPVATSEQILAYQQWYQQQYIQYVNQYMAYMTTFQQQQTTGGIPPQPPLVGQWPPQGMMMGQQHNPIQQAAVAPEEAPGQGQPNNNNRFPMLVHDPERPEQDWLDRLNTACRVGFLLAMIYFYSSALRFAVVMCAIFAVFFYRNRRALMGRAAPTPPPVANPEPPVQQPVVADEQAAPLVDGAPVVVNNPEGGDAVVPPPPRPDNNNNNLDVANRNAAGQTGQNNGAPTTVLSFLRTFVTSFFYSLLPEPAMAP